MLLLKKKTFDVESTGTRVAADEAAVVARAEDVVSAAEAEAAETRRAAQAAYEAEKARGYADGLDAGKAEILMQKLNLVDESVRYMASIEDKMAEIVMKALRKCVAEIGDRELVVQIVKKAMHAVVRNQRQITIKVNPEMVGVVKERLKGRTPKVGTGSSKPMTKAEIMAIRDPELRQKMMLENRELFNF